MTRGRKPKPTRLKVIGGTYRADRHGNVRGAEPMPRRGRPQCPSWLSGEAKSKWRKIVPELDRLGLLTVIDGDCLAAYCEAWAEFRSATETLAADGYTVATGNGGVKAHPAVARQRSAWKAMREFASLYGLDPSSRTRLTVQAEIDQFDPLEELLRRGEQDNGGA